MSDTFEDRVRARAQEIWEEEGRPDGKAEEHWQRASEELRSQKNSSETAPATQSEFSTSLPRGGTKPSDSQSSSANAAMDGGRTAGNATGKAKPYGTADPR